MLVTISTCCPFCGKENNVTVNSIDFEAWENGALIQDVMPYLSADEREALISGICPSCWDKMFPPEEEEELEEEEEPEEFDYDFADTYMEIGFNPYMGCYDEDC